MYAPIVIPTLNRYQHLHRCLLSLCKCKEAIATDLYIALDYPSKESHWMGYNEIKKLLSDFIGFQSITIIERESNYGAQTNLVTAMNQIFETHEHVIITEDDNEFSPNFLDYSNQSLLNYKDNPEVFAICGYNYPVELPKDLKSNMFLWKGYSGWGCAMWKDKLEKLSLDIDEVNSFLGNPKNIKTLNKYSGHYLPALLEIVNKNHMTGDTFVSMYLLKNKMYCLFPTISKVRNYGHDGTGVHGGVLSSGIYFNQQIDVVETFVPELENGVVTEIPSINKILKQHFKLKSHTWIYTYAKYAVYLGKNFFNQQF
jgi:hypothetical protein